MPGLDVKDNGKQKINKNLFNKFESIPSEYSADKKNRKDRDSPKKIIKKKDALLTPSPSLSPSRLKPSQFDHIYIQR